MSILDKINKELKTAKTKGITPKQLLLGWREINELDAAISNEKYVEDALSFAEFYCGLEIVVVDQFEPCLQIK